MANTVDINAPLLQREVRNVQTPPSALGSVGLPSNMNNVSSKTSQNKKPKTNRKKKVSGNASKANGNGDDKKGGEKKKHRRALPLSRCGFLRRTPDRIQQ